METLFELTFQDQTLNPQVGTFTDASQITGTFTLEDGEYYLTNGDTKGFYAYSPVAMQSGLVDDSKVIIEFDLKVVTVSVNTHTIIGTYAGVDGSGIPTGAKITLQYNNGDIELVLGSGGTATLIESADVVVDQWYHFRIDCYLAAPLASTYQVKIDGVSVTTVTGATTDYELGIISVLGTDLHACDECGVKNITLVTETNMFVGRTALDQALQDVKGYVDANTPAVNNATLTIQKNGTTIDTFTANSSTDKTINITVPTVNNATLTIQKNGTTIDTFTANSSTDKTVNITVPTATSELVNDSGFITSEIDSMGEGWVRFKSGLQICYGKVVNNNNIAAGQARFSFPQVFSASPSVVASPNRSGKFVITCLVESDAAWVLNTFAAWISPIEYADIAISVNYVAVGKWK